MFQIEPKTVRDYVTDESIKMPRFQRSEVWKEKQKFDLMLSICKLYPIGSVILCCEENKNGITEKWLIDGRQRYSTIQQILLSPDLLWNWAKKSLKVNDRTSDDDVSEKFIDYLDIYTNYDKTEHEDDPEIIKETDDSIDTHDTSDEDNDEDESYDNTQDSKVLPGKAISIKNDSLSIKAQRLLSSGELVAG